MRTLSEIIDAAGGPGAIAAASEGAISKDAVYKWAQIGVQDRHWEILIRLAGSTADELYQANRIARGHDAQHVEAAE